MELVELPPGVQRAVARELQPSEHVVWAGYPLPLWPIWVQISISVLGAIVAAAGSFLIDLVVTKSLPTNWQGLQQPSWLGLSIGSAIVLVGSFVGVWPIFDSQLKRRSLYLVTNRRAVSRVSRFLAPPRRRVYDAGDVLGARIEPSLGGRSHLILREEREIVSDEYGEGEKVTADGFYNIRDADRVLDVMRRALVDEQLAGHRNGASTRGGR